MSITSRSNKPNEWAAKINHTHIVNDPYIKSFIEKCELPKEASEVDELDRENYIKFDPDAPNSIHNILAVDGGYTTVNVKRQFPNAEFAFFQFGAILFQTKDLDALSDKPFIFPEDMQKLHNLERFKLALPIRNIRSKSEDSLTNSIRRAVYEFFVTKRQGNSFMETLKWFLFEEYRHTPLAEYRLGNDPNTQGSTGAVVLKRDSIKDDFTFDTPNGAIFLTDVFRLHEAIDEEHGAGGILGYVTRLVEQLILVHFIRFIAQNQTRLLNNFLFIADGPLSFSGQTANMHVPMRNLCNHYRDFLKLAGIEKSGPFVEHAREIGVPAKGEPILKPGMLSLLSNRYIYRYIVPGDPSRMQYGSTSYYGGKVLFHSPEGQIFVITIPVPSKDCVLSPELKDYRHLQEILQCIVKLRCSMYDDSIVPIALANKLVSLANHPSKLLLEKFAQHSFSK